MPTRPLSPFVFAVPLVIRMAPRSAWFNCIGVLIGLASMSYALADDPTTAEIFQAWRARQAQSTTVRCSVQVVGNYAAGSQLVPGEQKPMPITSRSSKRVAELLLSGPAKWRIDHQGNQFHRRLGRMLNFDLTRLFDGNKYLLNERGYDEVADWTPQPRIYSAPRFFRQELYWIDVSLTPLLLHYRPFNSQLCPFAEMPYVIDKKSETIKSHRCVVLRPADDAPFSVRTYVYWVAPKLDMSVVRIQRLMNGRVDWQFDIDSKKVNDRWTPSSYEIRRMAGEQMVEFSKVKLVELEIGQVVPDERFEIELNVERSSQSNDKK